MNFYPDLALQKDSISLPDAVYYVYIYNFYLISKPLVAIKSAMFINFQALKSFAASTVYKSTYATVSLRPRAFTWHRVDVMYLRAFLIVLNYG